MFQSFYDAGENGFWVFVLCTLLLGAGAAYVTGRAIAETWRPLWQVVVYALLLGLVVRFMHFALFEEVLMSARNYAIDSAVLLVAGLTGYFVARRRQMAEQYGWERAPSRR
jgi:predicted permease